MPESAITGVLRNKGLIDAGPTGSSRIYRPPPFLPYQVQHDSGTFLSVFDNRQIIISRINILGQNRFSALLACREATQMADEETQYSKFYRRQDRPRESICLSCFHTMRADSLGMSIARRLQLQLAKVPCKVF